MKSKPKHSKSETSGRQTRGYLPLALGVGGLIYALFFFGAFDTSRLAALSRLLIPDVVVSLWCGGSEGEFGLFDRAGILLAAAVIMLVAAGIGNAIFSRLGFAAQLAGLERDVFAVAIGLATLSNFTLLVGLCGGLHYRLPFLVVAVATLFLQPRIPFRERFPGYFSPCKRTPLTADQWLLIVGAVVAVPFVLAYVFGGLLPPWDFDVREYHLQVPKEWYRAGAITFLPHNVYGNMPLGAEMFAILSSQFFSGEHAWWYGALTGKLIMALYAPLGALGVFAAARRWWSTAAGVTAGLVYLSLPGILGNAIAGLNETPLATYTLLALFAVARWSELVKTPESGPAARGFLILAGYLAGAAAGCKYPASVFLALPLALGVLCWPQGDESGLAAWLRKLRWRECVIVVVAALAGGGLWYAKNWALAGNPVYPLAYNIFGGKTRTSEKDAQWRHAVQVPEERTGGRYAPSSFGSAAIKIVLGSEQLSLVLWPAAIAAVVFFARDRRVRFVALAAAFLFLTWWLLTHRIERFWLPFAPFVALLAGVALGALWQNAAGRFVAGALLAISLLHSFAGGTFGLYAKVEGEWQLAPYPYFVALETQRTSPESVNPFHIYMNEHTPVGKAVLLVGDAEPFTLEPHAIYNTCFDDCIFEQLLRDRSPDERRAALREHSIAYAYVHWGHIERYRSPGNYGFTNWVQPQVFEELVASGILRRVTGIEAPAWNGELYEVIP